MKRMDITKIPDDMPVEFLNTKVLKALTTEDWSALAFKRDWSNEKLGSQIVKAGRIIYEKDLS